MNIKILIPVLCILFSGCSSTNKDVSSPFGCDCEPDNVAGSFPEKARSFWTPSLITPNGDGINDNLFFMLQDSATNDVFDEFTGWILEVKTMSGQIIYSTNNYERNYSFQNRADGAYLFSISLPGFFSKTGKVLVNRNGAKVQGVDCCRVRNTTDIIYQQIRN
jgi:hypothetical protein